MFYQPPKVTHPRQSFLSPACKYNQRSFSAMSLTSPQVHTTHTPLRDQIRLESFKRSTLGDTKLNKTAFNKATLKVKA